jgi:hypothetical protein
MTKLQRERARHRQDAIGSNLVEDILEMEQPNDLAQLPDEAPST